MTEFEEKVIENLVEIKKQQQQIIETLNKSLDMAIGDDTFNLDFLKEMK